VRLAAETRDDSERHGREGPWPREHAHEHRTVSTPAAEEHVIGSGAASGRLSVLMIEDNPADADLVGEMLRTANLVACGAITPELRHVETLRDALVAAREPFDVALLDLGLPDASGMDGLTALSAAVPGLPAVVLTGARDPELAARALLAGAEDFLVKGEVEGDLLLRCLRFAIARHAKRQQQRLLPQGVNGGEDNAATDPRPPSPATSAGSAAAQAGPHRDRADASPCRVLLVEDNPGDAELVQIALSQGSTAFAVDRVERVRDALAYLSSREVDAVLLDLGLPDSAGMEGVEKMRAAFPELPIVILTGSYDVGVEAVRSGVQDFVQKDALEPQYLRRTIAYAVERNGHAQRARELARERAAHAATQAVAKLLEDANERLVRATREAREALEREAAARVRADHRTAELEALFASMSDPVLVYGEDGRVESTNPAATTFFGTDVLGLLPAGLIQAADIRSGDGTIEPAESLPASRAFQGVTVVGEKLRVRAAGGERVALVSASPLWRGDTVRGAVCVYRDVTELDRAEHSLREDGERKNHFLAMLSHELRNPLAPIRNCLYILERTAPGGEQSRRARTVIDRQVQHLTRLVDELLDVTRISRGKIALQAQQIDLCALARQVAEDHRAVFAGNGVELETTTAAPALHVNGDPTRIAQVIGNLLDNAAKFTPRGGRVALSVGRSGEDLAAISVRDTGKGIAPEVLEHLFEPFMQADSTLDRKLGGLGLGLALVKGLAEMHGGGAKAHSAGPGKGAEFVVTLPLDRARESRLDERVVPGSTVRARRILAIEDNADAAQSMKEVLELSGHTVEIAASGPEGLEKVRAFHPEIVLCDLGLPAMNGFEVARAMRADPALRSMALVAVSGYAAAADLEMAAAAGFDRHLTKPVDRDELERVIGEVGDLQSRRARAEAEP
jgi:PAS domain S-box-containing protein